MTKNEDNANIAHFFDKRRDDHKAKLNPNDYPGNLSLIFELDTRVCVITTTGHTYIGELSSFDNFGSVILSKAIIRRIEYGNPVDFRVGYIFIRSEQIMIIGKIDHIKEKAIFCDHSESD